MTEDAQKYIYDAETRLRRRKIINAWLKAKPKKAQKHQRKMIQHILKSKSFPSNKGEEA